MNMNKKLFRAVQVPEAMQVKLVRSVQSGLPTQLHSRRTN